MHTDSYIFHLEMTHTVSAHSSWARTSHGAKDGRNGVGEQSPPPPPRKGRQGGLLRREQWKL